MTTSESKGRFFSLNESIRIGMLYRLQSSNEHCSKLGHRSRLYAVQVSFSFRVVTSKQVIIIVEKLYIYRGSYFLHHTVLKL